MFAHVPSQQSLHIDTHPITHVVVQVGVEDVPVHGVVKVLVIVKDVYVLKSLAQTAGLV